MATTYKAETTDRGVLLATKNDEISVAGLLPFPGKSELLAKIREEHGVTAFRQHADVADVMEGAKERNFTPDVAIYESELIHEDFPKLETTNDHPSINGERWDVLVDSPQALRFSADDDKTVSIAWPGGGDRFERAKLSFRAFSGPLRVLGITENIFNWLVENRKADVIAEVANEKIKTLDRRKPLMLRLREDMDGGDDVCRYIASENYRPLNNAKMLDMAESAIGEFTSLQFLQSDPDDMIARVTVRSDAIRRLPGAVALAIYLRNSEVARYTWDLCIGALRLVCLNGMMAVDTISKISARHVQANEITAEVMAASADYAGEWIEETKGRMEVAASIYTPEYARVIEASKRTIKGMTVNDAKLWMQVWNNGYDRPTLWHGIQALSDSGKGGRHVEAERMAGQLAAVRPDKIMRLAGDLVEDDFQYLFKN